MITESQKRYFRNPAHKNVTEFFFTSNGAAFFTQHEAQLQAANLKKQGKSDLVTRISRADYEAQITAEPEKSTHGDTGTASTAAAAGQ